MIYIDWTDPLGEGNTDLMSQFPRNSTALSRVELVAFRLCAWTVVVCSFGAVLTKAIWGKPGSVPLHYLLILILAGALLGTFAPTLGEYALSRLNKLKFGGFEIELSDAVGQARVHLIINDLPPDIDRDLNAANMQPGEAELLLSDNPFPATKLSGAGLYQYEKLSHRLYLLFDQVKDPNELDIESKENFRKLISLIGKAAYAMGHYTKSLEVLLWLNRFSDRALNHDELRLLATAYLWAADETDKTQKRLFQNEAIPLLQRAIRKHPYQVLVTYNLGWALLSLDKYHHGIRQMRKCIKLDPRYSPWAKWNIACGLKRLEKLPEALSVLGEIPPGPWWNSISSDDWFVEPQPTEFTEKFQALCRNKLG